MQTLMSLVGRSAMRLPLPSPSRGPTLISRPSTALAMMTPVVPVTFDPLAVGLFNEAMIVNGLLSLALRMSKQKSLSPDGVTHATILGIGLWTFSGIQGWALCVLYLIAGSAVTKIKMKEKERLGIAEKREGARGPENVWGSAATAMACVMLAYLLPAQAAVLKVGYVASLATKLSDTFQSEIGKAFGKTTYLITTLKQVPRGTEGAVSLEGTLAGIVGSIAFSLAAFYLGLITEPSQVVATIIAAFVATFAESYIGATFQDSVPWLTNELVNLLNTLIGAVVAVVIVKLL